MTCEWVGIPGGGHAIVCGVKRKARCACGRPAPLLCDWKVPDRQSGTCDAPICKACATSPTADKDLCREHAVLFRAWLAER